jgi:hypothetical protein
MLDRLMYLKVSCYVAVRLRWRWKPEHAQSGCGKSTLNMEVIGLMKSVETALMAAPLLSQSVAKNNISH